MTKSSKPETKIQRLRAQGVLHRRAEDVSDELFQQGEFFDPHDLLQIKYEMLRRVENDHYPVSVAAEAFGLSRVSYYEIRAAWQSEGLAGLLPHKRGPQGGHKLTDEIVLYLLAERAADASLSATALTAQVKQRFGLQVHPRSIDRVLHRAEKKRR